MEHSARRQRAYQNISVPFLWEEKPGMPKKDYAPSSNSSTNPFVNTCEENLLFNSYLQSFQFDIIGNDVKETTTTTGSSIGSSIGSGSDTDDEESNDIDAVPDTKFFFPATQEVELLRTACFLQNGNGRKVMTLEEQMLIHGQRR